MHLDAREAARRDGRRGYLASSTGANTNRVETWRQLSGGGSPLAAGHIIPVACEQRERAVPMLPEEAASRCRV